jgi:hypothetical protein
MPAMPQRPELIEHIACVRAAIMPFGISRKQQLVGDEVSTHPRGVGQGVQTARDRPRHASPTALVWVRFQLPTGNQLILDKSEPRLTLNELHEEINHMTRFLSIPGL